MVDIFLSYAREDHARARKLAQALSAFGWSVFWDRIIPAGQTWRQYIGAHLDGAACVIVAWSQTSINSRWVQEEADDGIQRNVLVPVLFDHVTPPLGFRSIQATDLSSWDGTESSEVFRKLVDDITRLLPKPSTRGTSATEQSIVNSEKTEHGSSSETGVESEALGHNEDEEGVDEIKLRGDEAPERYEELKAKAVKAIRYWNPGEISILHLPDELYQLQSLETLIIGYYGEIHIPEGIAKLKRLRILEIHNANLTSIPDPIYELSSLEEMRFTNGSTYHAPGGFNSITKLSPKILQLRKLKSLDFDFNSLKEPPPAIAKQGIEAIRKYFKTKQT